MLSEILQQYPQIKRFFLPVIIGSIGLILFVSGLIFMHNEPSHESVMLDTVSQASESASAKQLGKEIIVDVEGAVMRPGVYKIPVTERLQNALIIAGGLSDSADRNWVEKHVNLAAKLSDGQKIYIPRINETKTLGDQTQNLTSSDTFNNKVNINSASAESLDALPGIGMTTAQKIITNRPFADIQELLSKKIVSKRVFDQIKDKIVAE